jgi:hypothetical protein
MHRIVGGSGKRPEVFLLIVRLSIMKENILNVQLWVLMERIDKL